MSFFFYQGGGPLVTEKLCRTWSGLISFLKLAFITGALRAKWGERGILRETNTKRGKRGGENKALYYSSPPVPRLALILRFA